MPPRTYVFVGPYAGWLVPEDEPQTRRDEALAAEVLGGGTLFWAGIEWAAVIVAGRPLRPYYGLPREPRHGAPERPMLMEPGPDGYFQPHPRPTDWSRLDRRAEVCWFRAAFAAELGRAAQLFGRAAKLHWGLVVEQLY